MLFHGEQQWVIFALIFFGVIGYVAWIRWRDRLWIDRNYGLNTAKMMSFGVNYFGLASNPFKRKTRSGFLLLLPDRLVYRGRLVKTPLEIDGSRIIQVDHGTTLGGVRLHQPVIKVVFETDEGTKDAAAFKVPYPLQWMSAIKNSFLKGE
jgi:hypothetical protein